MTGWCYAGIVLCFFYSFKKIVFIHCVKFTKKIKEDLMSSRPFCLSCQIFVCAVVFLLEAETIPCVCSVPCHMPMPMSCNCFCTSLKVQTQRACFYVCHVIRLVNVVIYESSKGCIMYSFVVMMMWWHKTFHPAFSRIVVLYCPFCHHNTVHVFCTLAFILLRITIVITSPSWSQKIFSIYPTGWMDE